MMSAITSKVGPVGVRSHLFQAPNQAKASQSDQTIAVSDALVPEQPLILSYHNGPLLVGSNDTINMYVIFYGSFSRPQRGTLRAFFQSFAPSKQDSKSFPTVSKWWSVTRHYVDVHQSPVAKILRPAGELWDRKYSRGRQLNQSDIESLILGSTFSFDPHGIYLVLTAEDVSVKGFCTQFCGQHFYTFPKDAKGHQIPYAWVGNPAKQCPGLCSWPYSKPDEAFLGPDTPALVPPNGDAGIDGMIISLGDSLASIATDPYITGYYQGNGAEPLEAAGACKGAYGPNSFPGFPGELSIDSTTGSSFNVYGARKRKFLMPWIWNPSTLACSG
ncbi:hypothetical protein O6H91_07G124700 [Diphasiastrum complanatum]|nr:hypothetical protein O6H91_07G124700 [Diphasiastrum complanatum]